MQNTEKSLKAKIRSAFDTHVIFYVLAIVISIACLYFILPLVFTSIANKVVATICCFLLIPLIRAMTESLINYHQLSIKFFIKQYLLALNFLVFGLSLLILAIPIMLSELMVILGGTTICILVILVAIGFVQNVFGMSLGRQLTIDEFQFALKLLGTALLAETIFVILKIARSKYDNGIWDLFAYVYATGVDWLERKL
jgi:hypothetical protein